MFLSLCTLTIIINLTSRPIDSFDKQTMVYCKKRCPQIFSDAPCLKRFVVKEDRVYNCICGGIEK
jgi:hypothetical protein